MAGLKVGAELILASLRVQYRTFALWVLCLSLAVTGLLIVDVFRNSLSETLARKGREILSADLSVSARRPLSEDELKQLKLAIPEGTKQTEVTEMLAMMTAPSGISRLTSVRFVEDNYPLAGELRPASIELLKPEPSAWLSQDLATLLDLKAGDFVRLGKLRIKVLGWIEKDSTQTFRLGNMAPRVYLHKSFLQDTGLMQLGTTFSQTRFYILPDALKIKTALEKSLRDPAVQVTTPQDLERGPFRVLSRLLDYLGLMGLVTLCLGWTGIIYLGRRWLTLERANIGILKCLGMPSTHLRNLLLAKLILLLSGGVLVGAALGRLGAQILFPLIQRSMPTGFDLFWSWQSSALLLLVGPLAGALLLLPRIHSIQNESALLSLQEGPPPPSTRTDIIIYSFGITLLFALITLLQAKSWTIGFTFLGSLIATVALLAGSVSLLVRYLLKPFFERRKMHFSTPVYLTLALWTRRREFAVLMTTVCAVAALLSQLIPHLEKSLVGELQMPPGIERPAVFLIDIQDEQISDLRNLLSKHDLKISEAAPFIRARILRVNDQPFERAQAGSWSTREQEMDARFRNRGVNLTFRNHLGPGDIVRSGSPWESLTTEVSVEEGYAERLGLKIGDLLQFDIQGVPVEAKIGNLREVDWNRFEPNFFITFKPGIVDEAPKTWILTVRQSPTLSPIQIQSLIVSQFPNVTSINVQETINSVSDLMSQLGQGLKIASWLCLGIGIFVALIILLFQMTSAQRDWDQLKTLGLDQYERLGIQILSHWGLMVLGALCSVFASALVAWSIIHFAFKTPVRWNWLETMQLLGICLLTALIGSVLIARRINRSTHI
jgi:putative ABC transport system permease protein